jgi:hypothetical protein
MDHGVKLEGIASSTPAVISQRQATPRTCPSEYLAPPPAFLTFEKTFITTPISLYSTTFNCPWKVASMAQTLRERLTPIVILVILKEMICGRSWSLGTKHSLLTMGAIRDCDVVDRRYPRRISYFGWSTHAAHIIPSRGIKVSAAEWFNIHFLLYKQCPRHGPHVSPPPLG